MANVTRLSLLVALVACAAAPEAPPAPEPVAASSAELLAPSGIETLRAFHTPDELHAYLRIGFRRAELDHVGFEQVSLAECIDRVVAASFAQRAHPDDAAANRAFVDALDVHRAVVQDVYVRRRAGAGSCLPGR